MHIAQLIYVLNITLILKFLVIFSDIKFESEYKTSYCDYFSNPREQRYRLNHFKISTTLLEKNY